jgi:hypothetical protein
VFLDWGQGLSAIINTHAVYRIVLVTADPKDETEQKKIVDDWKLGEKKFNAVIGHGEFVKHFDIF